VAGRTTTCPLGAGGDGTGIEPGLADSIAQQTSAAAQ
jgi:hypothetical protein